MYLNHNALLFTIYYTKIKIFILFIKLKPDLMCNNKAKFIVQDYYDFWYFKSLTSKSLLEFE